MSEKEREKQLEQLVRQLNADPFNEELLNEWVEKAIESTNRKQNNMNSTIEETLKQREKIYGKYENQAKTGELLLEVIRNNSNFTGLDLIQKYTLTMIAIKIGRILEGDASYSDNWHDIAGYATLYEKYLKGDK